MMTRFLHEKSGVNFYPKSFASPSLISRIVCKRFCLALPLYRQEQDYLSRGVPVKRQTMSNWILHFCGHDRKADGDGDPIVDENALIQRVVKQLKLELDTNFTVRQCGETAWQVILWPEESGKANASRGYIWEHASGEHSGGHKVILYVFEESRSADHLRKYLHGLTAYLVSDAYGAYFAIGKETGGRIMIAACWMHMRRKMAEAYIATKEETRDLSLEEFREHPAVKGLMLSNEVFKAEKPLRDLSREEREERREKEAAPKVDEFFSFIHELEKQKLEGKIGEAVTYGLNQEESLRVFLDDGDIPIDNGEAERGFKNVAIGRRNSLFSYSVNGAKSNAMFYSVIATAKANGADAYTYLKYLFEEINPKLSDSQPDDGIMMPWSQEYKEYESRMRECNIDVEMPASNLPPSDIQFKIKSFANFSLIG